jgi:ATP-binding cassette subfamily G (WHITE) protein 2 (SNQ2)
MWGSALPPGEQDPRRNPWHEDDYLRNGREEVESAGEQSDESNTDGLQRGGTWGERDAGRLDTRVAAEDLEVLRGELASLSKTRSQGQQSQRSHGGGLARTMSRISTRPSHRRGSVTRAEEGTGDAEDDEPGDIEAADEKEDEFELDQFMKYTRTSRSRAWDQQLPLREHYPMPFWAPSARTCTGSCRASFPP